MQKEYLVVEYQKTGVGKVVKSFTSKLHACEFALEQYQQHRNVAGSDFEVEEAE